MEGLKTPVSVIWQVIKARTEGMGLNAAARTFNKAKNTILAWESKFTELHQVLFLYALVHEFFVSVIEGDEAYTKVRKNVPPDQSPGWTILLMDRASRFIWELECGKKDRKRGTFQMPVDSLLTHTQRYTRFRQTNCSLLLPSREKCRKLFQKAIKSLDRIARQTHDLSIFTDGERRYGNLLFEICHELVKNGKPGRPKKTFKRGVHVRVKNKGSQAHKKGRKRPKYQSPWREHPETFRTIAETDIHANHAEAFWSALRRKCATFRRKTNTYAKATTGLQRLLRVYWVVHNFLRVHFTIREVPAVALGILERRLSVHEIFQIQIA